MKDEEKRAFEIAYNEQAAQLRRKECIIESLAEAIHEKDYRLEIMTEKAKEASAKRRYGKGKYFIMAQRASLQNLIQSRQLTLVERGVVFSIFPFIQYGTGLVVGGKKLPLSITEIGNLCGLSRKSITQVISSLVKRGIVEKISSGNKVCVKVSSLYFEYGKEVV